MSNTKETYKQISKSNFEQQTPGFATTQEVELGCLQRIADATELMATNYRQLQADLNFYKNRFKQEEECTRRQNRRIAALKGQITRLRKKQAKP